MNFPTTLRWYINDQSIAVYAFESSHSYPFTVPLSNEGFDFSDSVNIQIIIANLNMDNMDRANFNSIMMVNISSLLEAEVANISCGSLAFRSPVDLLQLSQTGL